MLIQESSAHIYWCPESGEPQAKFGTAGTFCIGRCCMAWRWLTRENTYGVGLHETSLGYCGKAGKPNADELKESQCKPSD